MLVKSCSKGNGLQESAFALLPLTCIPIVHVVACVHLTIVCGSQPKRVAWQQQQQQQGRRICILQNKSILTVGNTPAVAHAHVSQLHTATSPHSIITAKACHPTSHQPQNITFS
jgi:hypothetical protein